MKSNTNTLSSLFSLNSQLIKFLVKYEFIFQINIKFITKLINQSKLGLSSPIIHEFVHEHLFLLSLSLIRYAQNYDSILTCSQTNKHEMGFLSTQTKVVYKWFSSFTQPYLKLPNWGIKIKSQTH